MGDLHLISYKAHSRFSHGEYNCEQCTTAPGSRDSITRFCESLKHFLIAVSWGGHESLVMPKCAGLQPKDFDSSNIEHQYIRLYVGLEDSAYLVADLDQALNILN